jgi:GntR family transcriptional repressor for pyruvate dehydrogenase complex
VADVAHPSRNPSIRVGERYDTRAGAPIAADRAVATTDGTQKNLHPTAVREALALLPRSSKAESVADAIEQLIESESLPSGSFLSKKRDLCAAAGVAPSTLNEALKLLADRGRVFMRQGPRGGVFVSVPHPSVRLARSLMVLTGRQVETAEAMELRDALEPTIILHAVEHRTSSDMKRLRKVLESMDRATDEQDPTEFFQIHLTFHRELASISPNHLLRNTYVALIDLLREQSPRLHVFPDVDPNELLHHRAAAHRAIADAVQDRDVAAARKAAEGHAERGRPRLG